MLTLRLCGTLEVLDGDAPVALPASRKTRALLGYLAVTGVACKRSDLCDLFWDIPDDPRGALRWSLSKLRAVVTTEDNRPLVADRMAVQLDRTTLDVDLAVLRQLAEDPTADAVALARIWEATAGELLADCDLPNQPRFTDWLSRERGAVARLRGAVAQRLALLPRLSKADRDLWRSRVPSDLAVPEDPPVAQATPPDPSPRQTVRFLTALDGPNIAWSEVGPQDGPILVKAANWLTHLELDWDAPIWSPLFRDLAKDHRVIRYDERGCGMSDWDVADITFESFVTDLEQVVDAAGVDRFALMGISQGAAVSIEYACRHPDRVSQLILFGGYPVGWRPVAAPEEVAEREAVMVLTKAGWGRSDPTYRRLFSQTFMPEATLEELDWFDDFQRRTTSPENAVRFLEAFSTIDVRHRLAQVQAPTLVIHASGDRRIPYATGRDLAAQIPGACFTTLDSQGHLLLGREPAARDFVAAVRDFVMPSRGGA